MSQPPLTFVQAATPLVHWTLGPDPATRSRVVGVGLCVLVYIVCCLVAWHASNVGIMSPWAVPVLIGLSMPANLLILVLVRGGWTRGRKDPALMMPQNILALSAIAFSYVAITSQDRGAVLVLLALVIVFGMYTHTPRQTLKIGAAAVGLLSLCMLLLSHLDPIAYPPRRELIRFELLLGTLPVLTYTALQLGRWRDRLRLQRADLTQALATVQHLATRDALTGLVNRRHMQEKLDDSVGRLDRYGERFTVAIIDLDWFKRINDQYGHRVGDEVLASFAHAASGVLRESDLLGRWGGEEFLILFPDTAPEQAMTPLLRLRDELSLRVVSPTLPHVRVTFSAGVAQHSASATLGHTLERADTALYAAKRGGRNQVVLAQAGSPPSPVEPEPAAESSLLLGDG
jgi:diguanylate cyclase (GGDEF)-like protein